MITQSRLKEVLHYQPETGRFTWRMRTSTRIHVGDTAGGLSRGYIVIRVDGTLYQASGLAWLYVTGNFPQLQIDHKNTVKHENWFGNLRDVTGAINRQNRRTPQKNNRLGVLGVSPDNRRGFKAEITVYGKCKYLGSYATAERAYVAYVEAKRRLHSGCTL